MIVRTGLWANDWMATFSDGLRAEGKEGMILTRSVWAGAARLGVVLWSSDIFSTFEELRAQVPEGVAASISGVPWWTTDGRSLAAAAAPLLLSAFRAWQHLAFASS